MLIQSTQIDQLASALAGVQADLGIVIKQSSNDIYGSKYADLSRIWDAFQRLGPRHGLSVVQMPGHFDASGRTMAMSIRLMHNSGQWLGGEMSMPLSRADAHAYGSACTYARRYSLAALIGICPHDDDGNDACSPQPTPANRQVSAVWGKRERERSPVAKDPQVSPSRQGQPRGECIASAEPAALKADDAKIPSDPQGFIELRALLNQANLNEDALCRHYRVTAIEDLSPSDTARASRALKRKLQTSKTEDK